MGTATQPEDRARVAGVRDRLADLVEVDPSPAELALLLRLLRSFAVKAPPAAAELGRLLRAGDPGPVRDQAHALKGTAANIGVAGLAALCARIEDEARAGTVTDPGRAAELLGSEVDAALRAVDVLTREFEQRVPG